MKGISTINGLSSLILILINVGGVFRILFCSLFMMGGDIQDGHQMKRRIRNTILFLIVANSLVGISSIGQMYWG